MFNTAQWIQLGLAALPLIAGAVAIWFGLRVGAETEKRSPHEENRARGLANVLKTGGVVLIGLGVFLVVNAFF